MKHRFFTSLFRNWTALRTDAFESTVIEARLVDRIKEEGRERAREQGLTESEIEKMIPTRKANVRTV